MTTYQIAVQTDLTDLDRDYLLGTLADTVYASQADAQTAIDAMVPHPDLDASCSYYVEEIVKRPSGDREAAP